MAGVKIHKGAEILVANDRGVNDGGEMEECFDPATEGHKDTYSWIVEAALGKLREQPST